MTGKKIVIIVFTAIIGITSWLANRMVNEVKKTYSGQPMPTLSVGETRDHRPTSFRTKTVISPDGNYLVNLTGIKGKEGWDIRLLVNGQDGEYDTEFTKRDDMKWLVEDADLAWDYYLYSKISWSQDSRKLVAVINNIAYKWEFEEEIVTTKYEGVEYESNLLRITAEERKTIMDEKIQQSLNNIIFMGQDAVFINAQGSLYQLFPEEKLILNGNEAGSGEFWPLMSEDGFAYFKKSADQKSILLVLERNGVTREFQTQLSTNMDFNSELMMSPDLRHACSETGASGYYGYLIFKVEDGEILKTGQQYSWCERWLDKNTIVVREKKYHSQWSEQFYAIDVRTGTRLLLAEWEDKSF